MLTIHTFTYGNLRFTSESILSFTQVPSQTLIDRLSSRECPIVPRTQSPRLKVRRRGRVDTACQRPRKGLVCLRGPEYFGRQSLCQSEDIWAICIPFSFSVSYQAQRALFGEVHSIGHLLPIGPNLSEAVHSLKSELGTSPEDSYLPSVVIRISEDAPSADPTGKQSWSCIGLFSEC